MVIGIVCLWMFGVECFVNLFGCHQLFGIVVGVEMGMVIGCLLHCHCLRMLGMLSQLVTGNLADWSFTAFIIFMKKKLIFRFKKPSFSDHRSLTQRIWMQVTYLYAVCLAKILKQQD